MTRTFFCFTVRYQHGQNSSLGRHRDSSVFTINVNLNTRTEKHYQGSALWFIDAKTGEESEVLFKPGMAVVHLGRHMHAATNPIQDGMCTNMVIWVKGGDE